MAQRFMIVRLTLRLWWVEMVIHVQKQHHNSTEFFFQNVRQDASEGRRFSRFGITGQNIHMVVSLFHSFTPRAHCPNEPDTVFTFAEGINQKPWKQQGRILRGHLREAEG
jgi:hypothetical protein